MLLLAHDVEDRHFVVESTSTGVLMTSEQGDVAVGRSGEVLKIRIVAPQPELEWDRFAEEVTASIEQLKSRADAYLVTQKRMGSILTDHLAWQASEDVTREMRQTLRNVGTGADSEATETDEGHEAYE